MGLFGGGKKSDEEIKAANVVIHLLEKIGHSIVSEEVSFEYTGYQCNIFSNFFVKIKKDNLPEDDVKLFKEAVEGASEDKIKQATDFNVKYLKLSFLVGKTAVYKDDTACNSLIDNKKEGMAIFASINLRAAIGIIANHNREKGGQHQI